MWSSLPRSVLKNAWLYYANLAAYQELKIKFMAKALRCVDLENRSHVAIMSVDNRARALVKSHKYAKPLMPVCARCRSPTISEGGKIRENIFNHKAAKENNAKLSEEDRRKKWHRHTETANRREKNVCGTN